MMISEITLLYFVKINYVYLFVTKENLHLLNKIRTTFSYIQMVIE